MRPAGTPESSSPRVTGILTRRMISHINDRDVQALANPGLVVRMVTPQIIREVMAPASGLSSSEHPLPEGAEDELYRRLERERWLVARQGKFLRHRPEVRRAMLDLMRIENRERFDRTNELALQAFRKRAEEDDEARAEAIYHLLLGGRALLEEADALWRPSCGRRLSGAVGDLNARGRGYLTAKLGRSVPAETLASFSAKVLLPLLASFGSNYLRGLGADALLGVLRSAQGVFDSPSVSGLRDEALYRVGAWDALRDSAAAGVNSGSPGLASEALWQGDFEKLKASDPSALTALRFLLRWATRDTTADSIWAIATRSFRTQHSTRRAYLNCLRCAGTLPRWSRARAAAARSLRINVARSCHASASCAVRKHHCLMRRLVATR